MVPGAPSAWAELSHRFGRLSFDELLKTAITYAEEGYPVSPVLSPGFGTMRTTNLHNFPPKNITPGSIHSPRTVMPLPPENPWKSPDMAKTLRYIASSGAKSIYQGELARCY